MDTFNTIFSPQDDYEVRKREYELEERKEKINIEGQNILIKKIESLLDILESTIPSNDNTFGDKYNYISVFDEDELQIVKEKLFTLIEKY